MSRLSLSLLVPLGLLAGCDGSSSVDPADAGRTEIDASVAGQDAGGLDAGPPAAVDGGGVDAGGPDAGAAVPGDPADAPPLPGYQDVWGEASLVTGYRGGQLYLLDTCDPAPLDAALAATGPRLIVLTASGCNIDLRRTVSVTSGDVGFVCLGNATILGTVRFGTLDDTGPRTNIGGVMMAGCQGWDGPRDLNPGHAGGDGLELRNLEGGLFYRVGWGGSGDELTSHRRSEKVVWLASRLAYPLACNYHQKNVGGAACGEHDYGPIWSYGATEIAMIGSYMGGGTNRWPQMIGGNTDVAVGGGVPRSALGPRHPVFLVAQSTIFDIGVGIRCATGAFCRLEDVDLRWSTEMDPALRPLTSKAVPCTDEAATNCGSAWSFGRFTVDGVEVDPATLMDTLGANNARRDADRFGIPVVAMTPALVAADCASSGPLHPHPFLRRFCDNLAIGRGAQGAEDFTTGDAFPVPPALASPPDRDADGIPDAQDALPDEASTWRDVDGNGRYDVEDYLWSVL